MYLGKFRLHLQRFHESGVHRVLKLLKKYELCNSSNMEEGRDYIIVSQFLLILDSDT